MNKKVIIQLLLLIILFSIFLFVFFKYFDEQEDSIKETNKEINTTDTINFNSMQRDNLDFSTF